MEATIETHPTNPHDLKIDSVDHSGQAIAAPNSKHNEQLEPVSGQIGGSEDSSAAPASSVDKNGWLTRELRCSVNRSLVNKDTTNKVSHGKGFEPGRCTISELAEWIRQGFAYSYEYAGDKRSSANFVATDILSVDVDEGLTLEDAKKHPLVVEASTLIYTTASHTDSANRFRIIFALPTTLVDSKEVVAASRSLAERIGGDSRATDAARIFYGNSAAEIVTYDRGLSFERLDELIKQNKRSSDDDAHSTGGGTEQSYLAVKPDLAIKGADGRYRTITDYGHRADVHCPYHADTRPSATIYVNDGRRCIHCFACRKTFWAQGIGAPFDFDSFEAAARSGNARMDGVERAISATKFIDQIPLINGLNFVKSPKGSGKTKLLSDVIRPDATVLLVGHRKALLRHMCSRLSLNCYLDKAENAKIKQYNRRFGVCLDSISRHKLLPAYDYLILDESEQVLAHLISETISEKRHKALADLMNSLRNALTVVALDADLSWTSFDLISRWASTSGTRARKLFLNTYQEKKGQIDVFATREHITADIFESVRVGKRCFITSNSKKYIEAVEEKLKIEDPDIKLVAITSDTTKIEGDAAGLFIFDPVNQSRRYQVVLATPSIGTGVDITFDHNERYFDVVYGVFEAEPTDHFECDQQISRVRHPGQVKVFVSPQVSQLETDPEVVRRDLLQTDLFGYLHEDVALDATERVPELLKLAIAVTAGKRASKNNLRKNFLAYKEKQGWDLRHVETDKKKNKQGKALIGAGRELATSNLVNRLMSAQRLLNGQLVTVKTQKERGLRLNRKEADQLQRAEIESFFRCDIFPGLIEESVKGDWRSKVVMFESVINSDFGPDDEELISLRLSRDPSYFLMPGDDRREILLRAVLKATPLYNSGCFDQEIEYSTDDLNEFVSFVRRNKEALESQFGIPIRKDLSTSPMKQLAVFLEKINLKHSRTRVQVVGGRKIYHYQIDKRRLSGMNKLARIRKETPPRYEALEDR